MDGLTDGWLDWEKDRLIDLTDVQAKNKAERRDQTAKRPRISDFSLVCGTGPLVPLSACC